MTVSKLVLDKDASFDCAIQLLDQNGNGVLPVVDSDGILIGLIGDGDIRKAILKKELDLEHIINRNPCKLNIKSSKIQRVQYLKSIKRRQLPLVDDDGKFISLFTLDEVEFNKKPNAVVIMAGGLGTRLGELTKNTPKPMLHVGKKPILEIIIEKFIEFGFYEFYISVNYKKEIIKDYFQDGQKWGINISYLEEDKRLGTGGALSLIKEATNEAIIVTNGDVLTNIDFDELLSFHESKKSQATMCVREYEHIIPYGVVETDVDKIIGLSEKPRMKFSINTGVYILSPTSLNKIPENEFYDLPSLFSELIENNIHTYYFKTAEYWIDIGHKDEYLRANSDFEKSEN
jgi:dTDP-glucose pyrophosphorylase